MKYFFVLLYVTAFHSAASFAEICSIRPILKFNEQGLVSIPMNVSWIGAIATMQMASADECFAEGQKWKVFVEAEPDALKIVRSLEVTFGSGQSLLTKNFVTTNP